MALEDVTFFPVNSSNVESFGYDSSTNELFVRFLAKGNSPSSLYVYEEVTPDVFESMFNAPSKGQFIWQFLRGRYVYKRLE